MMSVVRAPASASACVAGNPTAATGLAGRGCASVTVSWCSHSAALGYGGSVVFRAVSRRRVSVRAEAGPTPNVIKVVGIPGSVRQSSWNRGLLLAAQEVAAESFPDLELEILDISKLPFVNTDLPKDALPEEVRLFRAKVLQANAVLFASPEYNYGISGVLKNAIDWGSYPSNVWGDKPAAIVSAGGSLGGARGQTHLRQLGLYIDIHFLNKPELFVKGYEPPQKFDETGNLVDPVTRDRIKQLVEALRAWTIRLQKI